MTPDLRVGGLTPLTSIDFPGELAAVIFCQGCPWRCRYCHNGHLLQNDQRELIEWETILAFLEKRTTLLDAVIFSGGEPTLQSALPNAISEVKSMGYKTGLHTAGCYPDKLDKILPMLDWVALDIKAMPENYPAITGIPGSGDNAWQSLQLIMDSGVNYEVRTTRIPTQSDDHITTIASQLASDGVKHYALQKCRVNATLDPSVQEEPCAATEPDLQMKLQKYFSVFSYRS